MESDIEVATSQDTHDDSTDDSPPDLTLNEKNEALDILALTARMQDITLNENRDRRSDGRGIESDNTTSRDITESRSTHEDYYPGLSSTETPASSSH